MAQRWGRGPDFRSLGTSWEVGEQRDAEQMEPGTCLLPGLEHMNKSVWGVVSTTKDRGHRVPWTGWPGR